MFKKINRALQSAKNILISAKFKLVVLVSSLAFIGTTNFAAAGPADWFKSLLGNITTIFLPYEIILMMIVELIYSFINFLLKPLVSFSGWIFDGSLNLLTTSNTSIVTSGWATSLSIANLFFMIILLAIAGATILGLEKFNYKKALPPFLIAALLINFSLTIGNSIIGTTNIFANFFYSSIKVTAKNSTNVSETIAQSLKITAADQIESEQFLDAIQASGNELSKSLGSLMLMFIFSIVNKLITIFVFLAGAVFMIYRTFYLWLLLILAPLAWIAYTFPVGSKIRQQWSNWWSKFISWSLFAPVYLFFTYLAIQISKSTFSSFDISSKSAAGMFSFGTIVQMVAVAFIMVVGVLMSSALGATGGNFVVSYVNKSGKAVSDRFKKFMPSETYGEKLGKSAAQRAAGLFTLGGRVSVPGVLDKKAYTETMAREAKEQRKKDMESEKLNFERQRLSGLDESARRQQLLNHTASARSGTGTTSLEQAAAINLLMEDKAAMENISEMEQSYMRQAIAATTLSNQDSNIQVPYTSSLKIHGEEVKKSREKQGAAWESYAKFLTQEDKQAQKEARDLKKEIARAQSEAMEENKTRNVE